MPQASGPKQTAKENLVFAYDVGDVKNSYAGEPTTNLETNNTVTFDGYGWGHVTTTVGWYYGKYCMRCHVYSTGNKPYWTGAYQGIAPSSAPGDIFTRSCEILIEPGGKHSWTPHVNATHGGTGGENTYYDLSKAGTWQKLKATVTSTSSSVPFYFYWFARGEYDPQDVDFVLYFYNPQLEQKSHATPFVNGARSSTQGLLDLTNRNTIDLSNVSFDANAQITFDGTNDYIDLGADTVYKTGGGWTIESVVYYNSVAGGYNNITSPANFIGSDTISYNSWYWSVLDNKLALWNISPGVWKYGSTTLQSNTYYHIVLVCDNNGTSYQMYVNGNAEGGDHTTYLWNPSYSGLLVRYIGRGNSSNVRVVNGKIPIPKIYNRALTATEIQQNYKSYKTRFKLS